jgi:transposase
MLLGMDDKKLFADKDVCGEGCGASGKPADPIRPEDLRLERPDRKQMRMEIGCLDERVPEDHPVRLIWEVTGKLDLMRFYSGLKVGADTSGRSAKDPRLLVALWLYAATEGIGSAREVERRCRRDDHYKWLCGGVEVNYHTLSDFRTGHEDALDDLFTQVLAVLADKELVQVYRISQDGTRVRACAGAASFRREERLSKLYEQARCHVQELKKQVDAPAAAEISARQKAARQRAAEEREARVKAALGQLPKLQTAQEEFLKKCSRKQKETIKKKRQPRASTTDPEARVMKMPDGGFRPAYNVQLAQDPVSRAIVGVDVSNSGVDTGQGEPMRQQVQDRTGRVVGEHLMDGGYVKHEDIDNAKAEGVTVYAPPKPPRNKEKRTDPYQPRPGDSEAVKEWRERMGSEEGKAVYKQRGATSETVNGDLKTFRGLGPLLVRGLVKVKCVALWSALAYNLMHFGCALLGRTGT